MFFNLVLFLWILLLNKDIVKLLWLISDIFWWVGWFCGIKVKDIEGFINYEFLVWLGVNGI